MYVCKGTVLVISCHGANVPPESCSLRVSSPPPHVHPDSGECLRSMYLKTLPGGVFSQGPGSTAKMEQKIDKAYVPLADHAEEHSVSTIKIAIL